MPCGPLPALCWVPRWANHRSYLRCSSSGTATGDTTQQAGLLHFLNAFFTPFVAQRAHKAQKCPSLTRRFSHTNSIVCLLRWCLTSVSHRDWCARTGTPMHAGLITRFMEVRILSHSAHVTTSGVIQSRQHCLCLISSAEGAEVPWTYETCNICPYVSAVTITASHCPMSAGSCNANFNLLSSQT